MYQLETLPALNLYKGIAQFYLNGKKFSSPKIKNRRFSGMQKCGPACTRLCNGWVGGADGGLSWAGPIPRQAMSLSRLRFVLCGTSGGCGQAYRSPWKLLPGVGGAGAGGSGGEGASEAGIFQAPEVNMLGFEKHGPHVAVTSLCFLTEEAGGPSNCSSIRFLQGGSAVGICCSRQNLSRPF